MHDRHRQPWTCPECGAEIDGGCSRLAARCRIDAEVVAYRLEEAGRTLLALPGTVGPAGYRSNAPAYVLEAVEAYGYNAAIVRVATPSATRITRMDEAWRWLATIPADRYVLRRIVGARSLVSPRTDRHLYSFRRIARAIGADYKAVQRWHAQGIDTIVATVADMLRKNNAERPCSTASKYGTCFDTLKSS